MTQRIKQLRLIAVFAAAIAALALPAAAQAREPAPGYSQFAGCPSPEEDPLVVQCTLSTITSGHFQMGSKDVPITNPITLSGGLHFDGTISANAKGGLSPSKQKVPGGVVGLTGLTYLLELFGSEALTLYAVTEIAGQPSLSKGILNLPIKVHLINNLLGNNCYVGSVSNPISLHLTTGTTSPPPPNEPITGKITETSYNPTTKITSQKNGTYVDNSFAAPGANGCQLKIGFIPIGIDGLVNSQSGLPSPAGTNETIQNFNAEAALKSVVYPAIP
jgi:hypothetical protein